MNPVTLQEIESYDSRPQKSGEEKRFLCCLSDLCRGKPRDSAHRSLSVNTRTGFYICHRCGAKGKLREFWEEKPKLNFKQRARMKLSERFSTTERIIAKTDKNQSHQEPWRLKWDSMQTAFADSAAEEYLLGRQIPPEISRAADCGFAAQWEHWENIEGKWKLNGIDRRVVFPVRDKEKNLVAIQGRAIDREWIASDKITRGDKSLGVFYSAPDVFEQKVIAVCEGAVDALALQTCGVAAVAMMGKSAPDWLSVRLGFKAVLLATDADEAGDEAAARLEVELKPTGASTMRLRPKGAKDWGEALEKRGVENLSKHFAPFSREATDQIRVDAAYKLSQAGEATKAKFIAGLVEDGFAREYIKNRIKDEGGSNKSAPPSSTGGFGASYLP